MKTVKIILGKDGSIKTDANGFIGESCIEKTQFLRELFDAEERKLKSEYYQEKEKENICDGLPSGWCG